MVYNRQFCVIGIGNPDCGDDGAGHAVIDLMKEIGLDGINAVKVSGEVSSLIEIFSQNSSVILVDAIATVSNPGGIHRFDARASRLPSEFFTNYSTHSMGVDEAIEMARALETLPEKIIVYGIEGVNFEAGNLMCTKVRENLDELTKRILAEISNLHTETEFTLNQNNHA